MDNELRLARRAIYRLEAQVLDNQVFLLNERLADRGLDQEEVDEIEARIRDFELKISARRLIGGVR